MVGRLSHGRIEEQRQQIVNSMEDDGGAQGTALEAKPPSHAANDGGRKDCPEVNHVHHAEQATLGQDTHPDAPPRDPWRLNDAPKELNLEYRRPEAAVGHRDGERHGIGCTQD